MADGDVVVADVDVARRKPQCLPIERLAKIPAIAVSAYVASSDRARALKAGFDRYLHKPVDFDELIANIRAVISL